LSTVTTTSTSTVIIIICCPTLPFKPRAAVAEVLAALSQHLSRLSLLAAPITRHIYHLSTVLL
jgi:hypothetical protein